jgi:hypothetical protein
MDSLGILASLFFVIYLIYWSLKNDKVRSIKEQVGFFRMRNPGTEPRRPRDGARHRADDELAGESTEAPETTPPDDRSSLASRLKSNRRT